jgi:uncharacterized protein YijF (DUF1287 family)
MTGRARLTGILLIILVLLVAGFSVAGRYLPKVLKRALTIGPACPVRQVVSAQDQNNNGISDSLDIVNGARSEVKRHTRYDSSYYQGGYPPEGKGACTDLVWRALQAAGYNLKQMVDDDIRRAPAAYGADGRQPDPNIDFRRVTNLQIYFSRHAQVLTNKLIPGDQANQANWQPGDIVVFAKPHEHVGIISDRRCRDGVPLLLHNPGPWARETDCLTIWPSKIAGHYRITD